MVSIALGDQGKFVPNKNYPSGELNVTEGGEFSLQVNHGQFDLDVSIVHESNTSFCDFFNGHGHCRQRDTNQSVFFTITSLLVGGGGRFIIRVNVTGVISSYQLNIVVHKLRSEDFTAYLLHKIAIASVIIIAIGCILISKCSGSVRTVTVEQDEFLIDDDRHLIPLDYEFSKEKLTMGNLIGEGTFETVFMAQAENILLLEPSTTVAVKMTKRTIGDAVLHMLLSDLTVLIEVGHHLNIVNFFGAVTSEIKKRELMIIYEFCEHGNIESFLRNNVEGFVHCHNLVGSESKSSLKSNQRRTTIGKPRVFNTNHLIHWAVQVADGMAYLASKHVLHGDLAARNILLTNKYVAKISDFGVMRNVQLRNFYQKHPTIDRFKWFALETIADQVFSTKSDVWAYGVFLWELFSLGSIPYDEVDKEKVLAAMLCGGFRMERPKYSDEAMYGRMLLCWNANPKLRPTFETLSEELKTLLPVNIRSVN
ncbi:vascular endothelial growth factor receptor 1-like [Anopheles ziemanni]|uniref:vascular endothelial growth factor receptor 1-like n=1 Tax=Anopheles coustani TaxID=139045 RepID=UPI00265869D1|nr:vascular endothelial growth factor receptor 1-like [Anopheles coustani]XP_058169721.1 vascular endothelial growth factor receptor 1-like [Anopheles ziemanni]